MQFNTHIHSLISNGKNTLVVFKNGAIHELSNVIEQRKKMMPTQVFEKSIKNIICQDFQGKFFVGISVEGQNTFYWCVYNTEYSSKFTKIELSRDAYSLRGISFHQEKDRVVLLTLCKFFL